MQTNFKTYLQIHIYEDERERTRKKNGRLSVAQPKPKNIIQKQSPLLMLHFQCVLININLFYRNFHTFSKPILIPFILILKQTNWRAFVLYCLLDIHGLFDLLGDMGFSYF